MNVWVELVDGSPLVDVVATMPGTEPMLVLDMWKGRVVRHFDRLVRERPMSSRFILGQIAVPVTGERDEIATVLRLMARGGPS